MLRCKALYKQSKLCFKKKELNLGSVVSLAVISRAHGRVVSLLCPPAVACGAVRGAHVFAEPHARLLLSRGITIVILIAAVITAHHRARRGQKLV